MKYFVTLFLVFNSLLSISNELDTVESYILRKNFTSAHISNFFYSLADSTLNLTPKTILETNSKLWNQCSNRGFSKPINEYNYWLKINIICKKSGDYYLENNYPLFDEYNIYEKINNNLVESKKIETNLETYTINLTKGNTHSFYIFLKKRFSTSYFQFRLYDKYSYLKNVNSKSHFNGVLIGLYLLLISISFFASFILKNRMYFYYSLYNLSLFCIILLGIGAMGNVFHIHFKGIGTLGLHFSFYFTFYFLFLIVSNLLDFKNIIPLGYKFIRYTLIFSFLLLLGKLYFYYFAPELYTREYHLLLFLLAIPLVLSLQFLSLKVYFKTKENNALYFSIAFIADTLIFLAYSLIPFKIFRLTEYSDFFKWFIAVENVLILAILIKNLYDTKQHKIVLQKELITQKEINTTNYLKGQSEERKRFANQLHDSINLKLSTLKIQLSRLDLESKYLQQLDEINQEIRSISHAISPISLQNKGVVKAINENIFKLEDSYPELIINFKHHSEFELSLDKKNSELIYWTCLELINNIIKHANASQIKLTLYKIDGSIILSVCDNGIGYDKKNNLSNKGIGLKNITDRALIMNGVFITTNLTVGMKHEFKIPN